MSILLNHGEVAGAVTMAEAVAAAEEGFRVQARGEFSLPPRLTAPAPKGWLRMMPAILSGMGVMGFKAMNLSPGVGVRYVVFLYRIGDGELLAIMDAEPLTTQRTGAVSAVATKWMARADASTVGVIGSGAEAKAQLRAMAAVRQIRAARAFSPNREHRTKFAVEMSQVLGIDVSAVDSARDAVRETDLVVLAVKATTPVFFADWLEPGMHVNAIGSVRPEQREIDTATFRKSALVVVDYRHEAMECGDGVAAKADGLDGAGFHELTEVVTGKVSGRADARAVTLFKSVGNALQDLALAKTIYEAAVAKGMGRDLGAFPHVKATG
jgi:ornithine cyclodeaminase/alanine dehydrogenase